MPVLDQEEVRRLYDRLARSYDILTNAFGVLGFEKHKRSVIDALDIPTGATVVDLCCGTGRNFESLAAAVGPEGRIIGVDLSNEMLRVAEERVREK